MKTFEIKTKVIFEKDALSFIEGINGKTFVVTDPYMVESGMVKNITNHLLDGNYLIFSDIVPDPPMELVVKGVEKVVDYKPDNVIALGGGSAIDAAKAILHFSKEIGNLEKTTFIAIPTTSGTGSEVTNFAVITDTGKGIKYPLVTDSLLPDIAILEPGLVKSVPPPIIADTGMDVLTHAVEAYVSTKANDFSDAFAQKAVSLVFEYLIRSYKSPNDIEAKEKMHSASCMAGLAFNLVSLGLNHAIAHNIGGKLHIPHGRTNSILLPHVIEFNANISGYSQREYSNAAIRYANLAKLIGISGSNTRMLVNSFVQEIKHMQKEMKMPLKLTDCGKTKAEIDSVKRLIADGALEDACIITNPRETNIDDIVEIINKVS